MDDRNELINLARESGSKAPVDAAPDPTNEGFQLWKEDMEIQFEKRLDGFFVENHLTPHIDLHDEIVEAMKDGFKELVHEQPFVENPFIPREAPPRRTANRLIDEVFGELKVDSRHRRARYN